MKAMRKDRTRRYRSASELADDIQNYLTGTPLIAGPETAVYRARKFVRKHAGSRPIAGYENIPNGKDFSGISDATIQLRANLSSSKLNATYALHDWSFICTKALCESDWSNVVSSLQWIPRQGPSIKRR